MQGHQDLPKVTRGAPSRNQELFGCSSLCVAGFLSVLPRGQEEFSFMKQEQRSLSECCGIWANSFAVCAGSTGTVPLDQQQQLAGGNLGEVPPD